MTAAILAHRVFRLFISSTFSDFVAEREALQKRVFPELEKFCAERGARFQAVDLRWGITEEAQQEHDTLRICLEEVRRCQSLSPRPNFAVLLGDRYGWEPVPARIPIDHWKRLLVAATGPEVEAINAGYEGPDLNAIPPMMHLRKSNGDWASNEAREALLRAALRRAADAAGFSGDERMPYFASATHQEIALGALDSQDEDGNPLHPEEHVNVYVRRIEGLPNDVSARAYIDWDEQRQAKVQGARQRLSELESQLRVRLPEHVHDIQARWINDGTEGSHLDAFCAQFLSDQQTIIERELGSRQKLLDGEVRGVQHATFAKERARNFAGRKTVLRRIAAYLARQGKNSPLLVHGGGGTGKSALLASAYLQAIKEAPETKVILARFIGGVPGTESLMALLTELTADIAVAYGRPAPPVPESIKAARHAFEEALQNTTADRPLILFLDALDQLDRAEWSWLLEWLPKELGEYTRVVASTREGQTLHSARRRYPKMLLEVPAMTPAEGKQMLDAWLADTREAHCNAGISPARGRRLTKQQRERVLSTFAQTGKPLWLKLAYEEARNWASWHEAKALPETVEKMVEDLVARRLFEGENHPRVFATRALAYLSAGRFGLAEEELDLALATDPEVKAEFEAQNVKTGQKWEQDENRPRLPPILWSRLYFDLLPYLAMAHVDGTVVYRWFHREFKEEISKRYMAKENSRQATHKHLADTFFALAPFGDDLFKYTDASGTQQPAALRRVMEQPWQLAQAGSLECLQTLITEFGFCMGKCAANAGADLIEDYQLSGISSVTDSRLDAWLSLVREKGHLLRRGEQRWPCHKILLQVALEHADESAVSLAAEKWLDKDLCDWPYARMRPRPDRLLRSGCIGVFEGHQSRVDGALYIDEHILLSWSRDHTLRTWDLQMAAPRDTLAGHSSAVLGALLLSNGNVLSWSKDRTLAIWEVSTGTLVKRLEGHRGEVIGALLLNDGHVLSWSSDCTLRIWNLTDLDQSEVLRGHSSKVNGALELSDGSIISWSKDATLHLWNRHSLKSPTVFRGHKSSIGGVVAVGGGRVVSWSGDPEATSTRQSRGDRALCMWELSSGRLIWTVVAHERKIRGVIHLYSGSILSWSLDGTLARWNALDGHLQQRYTGHSYWVMGAFELDCNRLITWSQDDTIRMWSLDNGTSTIVEEVARPVWDACPIDSNRFAVWADGLTIWDVRDLSASSLRLDGHSQTTTGALFFYSDRVVTWSIDETLRLWDLSIVETLNMTKSPVAGSALIPRSDGYGEQHVEWVRGATTIQNGDVVSWSYDHSLRIWNPNAGKTKFVLCGHRYWVHGVLEVPGDRLVSWSDDCDVMIWDCRAGTRIATLQGTRRPKKNRWWKDALTHDAFVLGVELVNSETIASWAEDCTLRIWDLNTLEEVNLIELDSSPDGVISVDKYSLALWFEQTQKVEVWSILSRVKTSRLSLIEFNEQFPVHASAFGEENSEDIASLMCDDFGAIVDQGALKIKHRVYGDLYWHGDRTLELYSLSHQGIICASLSEKNLGFIRIEPSLPCTNEVCL
jgi:WD40 repeat protein